MKRITNCALALYEATGLTLLGLGLLVICMAFAMHTLGAEPPGHGEYRDMEKSVTVIGLEVENQQGQYLGEVKEKRICFMCPGRELNPHDLAVTRF